MRNHFAILLALFLVAPRAVAIQFHGKWLQGGLVIGKSQPGARIFLNDEPVPVTAEGAFLLGFGRDAPLQHQLRECLPQGDCYEHVIRLQPRQYKIERIDGVDRRYVSPPPAVLARIRHEAEQIRQARAVVSPLTAALGPFIAPARGRISGEYGSQRIFNGEPRRPHFGQDIAAPVGTPVVAPADGVVRLAEKDLYYSGGTIILDHGLGLTSSFLHLSRVLVKPGQQVIQGQKIGEIGATGRATGPHLDWRLNWQGRRLDPAMMLALGQLEKER